MSLRFFVWIAVSVFAGLDAAARDAADIARIVRRKELVVSLHKEDVPPFVYQDGKQLKGIDIELARLVAEKLGVKVRFVRTAISFPDVVELVSNGKADLAASALYPTLGRARGAIFTDPYWNLAPVIVINRVGLASRDRKKDIEEYLTAPTTKVGFYQTASFLITDHNRFGRAGTVMYREREPFMSDLRNGKIAAGYIDGIEVLKWRKAMPDLDLFMKVVKDEAMSLPVAFAVRAEDTHFAYWLNLFLKTSKTNGTLKVLTDRYLEALP